MRALPADLSCICCSAQFHDEMTMLLSLQTAPIHRFAAAGHHVHDYRWEFWVSIPKGKMFFMAIRSPDQRI
jgi:hypothetical protein